MLNFILYINNHYIDSLNLNTNKFNYLFKIINNSINKRNNFFTLNKGRIHIKEGMGVITQKGTRHSTFC